jgi:hypothetical protein
MEHMTIKDLSQLSDRSRKLIQDHMDKHGRSVNYLAVKAGVHPTQLWLFLRGERGLTDSSLAKIGKALQEDSK